MPSGNDYPMSGGVDVATALAQEFRRLS